MTVTTGMVGHGFYDRNSAPQRAAIEVVLPWHQEAIAGMDLADPPQAVGIADFGCAEGRNSIRVLQRLVTALRARTGRPVLTVQSDLPTNDFTALLTALRPGGRSVLGEDVYSSLVGGSMYDRLLPPGSIHVATTFNALGFFSRRPLERLPGYILPNGPSAVRGVGAVSAAEQAAFAGQAARDLESFLQARATELAPGGKLLVNVFGTAGEARTCDGVYDVLNDAMLEALDAGLIDRAGYEAYYQPVYFRNLDELTAPLAAGAPLAALYHLDRAAAYESAVPFVEDFRKDGDVAAYARQYTDFFRAFTEPVLCLAFPAQDPKRFADDVFGRAERLLRAHPARYPFRFASVAMLLTRSSAR